MRWSSVGSIEVLRCKDLSRPALIVEARGGGVRNDARRRKELSCGGGLTV